MAKKLTTARVPRRERVAFWNQAVSETFVDLGCIAGNDADSIEGEIDVRSFGGLQVSTVRSTAQLVTRGRSEWRPRGATLATWSGCKPGVGAS